MIDEFMLRDHLAQANDHVAQGERHLAQQWRIIEGLREGGHDLALAMNFLNTLEECQGLHVEHRDRLELELSKKPG